MGDGPYRRYVDLRVEIVIGSFDTEVVDNVQQLVFDMPMTDAQLEAQLDLFEASEVGAALAPEPRLHQRVSRVRHPLESIRSHATRDESGNNRFASRRIHFKLRDTRRLPAWVDWRVAS
jgi:hypothetical protein